MRDELAQALYNDIQAKNEVRVFKRWHASSIAECPRSHYFKRLGIKGKNYVGGGKMLRWKAGHLYEEAIRPHLEAVFPDLKSNERLESDTLDLTGEYDNYSQAEKMLIEDKTVHDFAFAYKKKGDSRFHLKDAQPYLNHLLQNHCYVELLREKGYEVEYITFVYMTLDGRIATYQTTVDPELTAEVQRRLKTLNTAWATKQPPECICNDKHPLWKSTMQYCDYQQGGNCCSLELLEDQSNKVIGVDTTEEWETT